MNKLFTKIAAFSVGLAMAIGVGVAIGSGSKSNEASREAKAASGDTLSIATYASNNSWQDTNAYPTINFDGYITITGATGGNNNKYYNSNKSWRQYEGDSAQITITASSGATLTSATFVYSNGNNGVLKYSGTNKSSGTAISLSGSSASFTVGHSSGTRNGNIQITSITVSYSSGATPYTTTINTTGGALSTVTGHTSTSFTSENKNGDVYISPSAGYRIPDDLSTFTISSGTATISSRTSFEGDVKLSLTGVSSNITISGSFTKLPTYTVTYNANGATSGTAPTDSEEYASGTTVTVKANSGNLLKTNYSFVGWNTQPDGEGTNYVAGTGTFTITANTTLYAKWSYGSSIVIDKDTFTKAGSGSGYTEYNGERDIGGITIWSYQTMIQSSNVQFQRSNGWITNKTSFKKINKVTLSDAANMVIYLSTTAFDTSSNTRKSSDITTTSGTAIAGTYGYFAVYDTLTSGTKSLASIVVEYEDPTALIAATINGSATVETGSQWTTGGITENVSGDTVTGAEYSFVAGTGVTISSSSQTDGTFTATGTGTVTVSASKDGYNISDKTVTVQNTQPYITLTLNSASNAYTGQTVSISSSFGNGVTGLEWSVTSGAISGTATESDSGYSAKIGGSTGTLTIKAKDKGSSLYETVDVSVIKTAFTTSPADASVGEEKTTQLSAALNSGGAITWESSSNAIATVDATGLVSGVKAGTATITAKSEDDTSVTTSCTITVTETTEATHTYASGDGLTVNIQKAGVTVATATMAQVGSRTQPTWNSTNSEYRLYGTSTLTITPAKNYEITSFKCVFTSNASSSKLPTISYSVDGGSSSAFATNTSYSVDKPDSIVIETSDQNGNYGFKSIEIEFERSETVVTLVSITYAGSLLKTTQYVGQKFDSVGLSFTAHYDDESTEPLLSSDITWNALALGNSVTGSYLDVEVTVTGLTIINSSDVEEIIYFNNLSSDANTYSDLDSYSKKGSFTTVMNTVTNGKESSIKLGSASNGGGSVAITDSTEGMYIARVILVAKDFVSEGATPTADGTTVTVAGSSTSDTFDPTDSWAVYDIDISADETSSVTISTTGNKHRAYIHSITLILESEDKTAVLFAQKILSELTCDASGATPPSSSQWTALSTYYTTGSNVSAEAKALLKTTSAPYETWKDYVVTEDSTESEIICAALVKYDYVVGHKHYTGYGDFIGRYTEGGANYGAQTITVNPISDAIGNSAATVTAITVASVVSVAAIGGYFFIRRRKVQ